MLKNNNKPSSKSGVKKTDYNKGLPPVSSGTPMPSVKPPKIQMPRKPAKN